MERGSRGTHAPLAPGNYFICIKARPGMNAARADLGFDLEGRQGKRLLAGWEDAGSCACARAAGRGRSAYPPLTFPCKHWKNGNFSPQSGGGYNLSPSSLNVITGSPPPQQLCHAALGPDHHTKHLPRSLSERLGRKAPFGGCHPDPKALSSTSAP